MIRRCTLATAIAGLLVGALPAAHATDYEVTVTNLTSGVHFSPLVLAAHPESARVFAPGMPASEELRAVAEGGDATALAAALESLGAAVALDDMLLAPGETRTFLVSDGGNPENTRLSIAGMLLPTNDGFVGLDSLALPGGDASDAAPSDADGFLDGDTDGGVESGDVPDTAPTFEEPEPVDETALAPPDPFGEPAPLDEAPGDELPVDELPLDEMPPDEMPLDEMPTDETLDADGSMTEAPVDVVTDVDPEAFAPLDGVPSMDADASVTVELLGYDAGTEANDEILGSGVVGEPGFPAPPAVVDSGTGTGASGIAAPIESFVHVHRGVQGDNDVTGGPSDINAAVHGWMNPVARVTVSVVNGMIE